MYDEETGLYYLRSRFYRTAICRFLNCDTNFNLDFQYCLCNPISSIDSTGCDPVPVLGPLPTATPTPTFLWSIPTKIPKTDFELAREAYESLYPSNTMVELSYKDMLPDNTSYTYSSHTFNWETAALYKVGQAVSDVSGEIGDIVDAAFLAYGIPYQPGNYIHLAIDLLSLTVMPDVPPATHHYTEYIYKKEYRNKGDWNYVSITQKFYTCNSRSCTVHNSGRIDVTVTTSNDILPFYYGSTRIHENNYILEK